MQHIQMNCQECSDKLKFEDNLTEHMNMFFVTYDIDFMNKCGICEEKKS